MATTKVTTGGITDATIATADIADQAITLAKLPHGTSSNDGKFLRANNGADPSFETVSIPAGTTINNNADNRVITGSGTANTLNGESNVVIDSSGNLGMGLTNPASLLHGMSGDLFLTANSTSADSGQGVYFQSTTNGWGTANAHAALFGKRVDASNGYLRFDTRSSGTTAERMRIDSSGSLLMGATSSTGFDSFGSGSGGIILDNVNSSNTLLLATHDTAKFFYGVDAGNAYLWCGTSHPIRIATNNTERMRIDSSGKVKIATTDGSPHANADELTLGDPSGTVRSGMTLNAGANKDSSIHFGDPDNNSSGQINYDHNGDILRFYTDNTKRVRIDSDGLKFGSDTAAANALDDYEEGTCTPQWVPASGSFGVIYQSGHYTKIGDVVHLTASISINGATNASGEVQITGLPFSVRSVNSTWSGEGGHGVGRWFYAGPNHFCFLVCDNSTDRIRVHKADGTFLNTSNMSTGYNQSQFSFTVTYLTDS